MALAPTADDVQPVANETRDRIITGTVTVLPVLALGVVAWQLWNDALGWSDVAIFLFAYVSTALAITVGTTMCPSTCWRARAASWPDTWR